MTRKPATETTQIETKPCGCGCGESVRLRSTFRPGHDARHAGNVGRALAADPKDKRAGSALAAMTPSLRTKAERVRDNAIAKAAKALAEAAATA